MGLFSDFFLAIWDSCCLYFLFLHCNGAWGGNRMWSNCFIFFHSVGVFQPLLCYTGDVNRRVTMNLCHQMLQIGSQRLQPHSQNVLHVLKSSMSKITLFFRIIGQRSLWMYWVSSISWKTNGDERRRRKSINPSVTLIFWQKIWNVLLTCNVSYVGVEWMFNLCCGGSDTDCDDW
jgi:hypothetical protein